VADAVKGKAIIFTTAYKNFAVDAFDRDAADYVVKPIRLERLQQAVQKVVVRMAKPKKVVKQINLNTDKGKALINVEKIFCIVTSTIDSRDKILFLNDNTKVTVKNSSFEKLIEMLPAPEFCRINKKAVIAIKHVQYYSHDEITADVIHTDGKNYTFPLSEIYRNDFIKLVKI
jgi:DNA-binding LytR/AlgR family response regulator